MFLGDDMQINRMFEIIYLLLENKTMTAKKLAEHFEVSVRTIYRDVENLSSAGIPIFMSKGKGGGISLLSDFVLNKAVLTQEEKEDVISALKALNSINLDSTNTALNKLGSLFGKPNNNWIEIDFSGWGNTSKQKETFLFLKNAIINKNVVKLLYFSQKGERTVRIVEPFKLCFKGQNWYLYAFCRERQDNRFFKLSRIRNIEIVDGQVERIPTETIFTDEDIIQYNEKVMLKLKFSPEMAFMVYDTFENYKEQPDKSFIVDVELPKADWLYNYIISFGDKCEVIEPQNIRNEVIKKLQNIQRIYL